MKNLSMILLILALGACSSRSGRNGGASGSTLEEDITREYVGVRRATSPKVDNIMDREGVPGAVSEAYRIPAVILTKANRLIVTSDARWGGNSDSANNIDSAYRYSDDGGVTWSRMEFFQHFSDFEDTNFTESGSSTSTAMSASFIDPGIVEAPNGDIITVTTVFPWRSGLFNTGDGQVRVNKLNPYFVQGGKTYLKLRARENTGDRANDGTYEYALEVSDWRDDGSKRDILVRSTLQPATGSEAAKADKNYYLYKADGTVLESQQYKRGSSIANLEPNTGVKVPANLFYYDNPYHVVSKNYLFMTRSTDNGTTFSKPYDISWQVYLKPILNDRETWFAGVSPGVGFKAPSGRVLFAIQQVPAKDGNGANNACQAISLYTDDNGNTWNIGGNSVKITSANPDLGGRFSESQYLATPDRDQLILIGRTKARRVTYVVSVDGGSTWSDPTNSVLPNCAWIGNMVGAANLYKSTYFGQPMIVITHVGNTSTAGGNASRINGMMSIGYLKEGGADGTLTYKGKKVWIPTFTGRHVNASGAIEEGDPQFWTYANNSDPREKFAYSMPIELPNGNIGWFYEGRGYAGGTPIPGFISWQEVQFDRSGKRTSPLFPRP